jgi:hypothetical protein
MKRWVHLVIGALCLIVVAACSHVQGYLDIMKEKGISEEYLQVLKEWTRSRVIHSQFETKAHISATLRSPEFNQAYHQEYARIYQLSGDERKKWEERLSASESESMEFIFYAYIPDKTENDFDRRGSIWSVFLINGRGEKIRPVEMRRIEPLTSVVTEFYPYINPYYGIPYMLRFPPQPKTGRGEGLLKLVFTSVIAKVELEFEGQ